MMTEEDAKKIAGYMAGLSESKSYQTALQKIARSIGKWLGIFALVTTVTTFILNGTDFFTKTIPSMVAYISKYVMLSPTFRPYLVTQVATELGYSNLCAADHQVIDLDGDRESTDLIVQFDLSGADCKGRSSRVIYVVLKESEWKGFLPKYTLLRTISPSADRVIFTKEGAFLVGQALGVGVAGYYLYGYANGLLHDFGSYVALGDFEGDPPKGQIGNRLFFATSDGLMSFEVKSNGEFLKKRLSAREVVDRNDTALVIEDERKLAEDDRFTFNGGAGRYEAVVQTIGQCDSKVFANGEGIAFTDRDTNGHCLALLTVNRATNVIANVRCAYKGFIQSRQFPWGKVPNPDAKEHTVRCPVDGDDGSYLYEVKFELSRDE